MKAFATGLLLAMTVLFLITRAIEDGHSGISYVRAFAEAGMVGALADWFAVTALFKHPLGLPIPHTAIIPNRKDDIGRGLGTFVQGNFLSGPVLGERLASIGVADKVGQWLADRHNAEQLAANAGDVVEAVTEVLSDEDVASAVQDMVDARLRAIPAAPLASRVLDAAVENGQHRVMLDSLLKGTSRAVEQNRDLLRIQLGKESPWWVPDAVDDRVFDKLYASLNNFLGEVAADPDHAVRRQMDERIRLLVDELRDSPEMAARGEELKAQLLDNPAVRQWSGRLWGELKTSLVGAAADPESELRAPPGRRHRQARRHHPDRPRAAGQDRRLGRTDRRLPRPAVRPRGGRPDLLDRREVGRRRRQPSHRAAGRPRPPVHPHQRHGRRRPRRRRDLRRRPRPLRLKPRADYSSQTAYIGFESTARL